MPRTFQEIFDSDHDMDLVHLMDEIRRYTAESRSPRATRRLGISLKVQNHEAMDVRVSTQGTLPAKNIEDGHLPCAGIGKFKIRHSLPVLPPRITRHGHEILQRLSRSRNKFIGQVVRRRTFTYLARRQGACSDEERGAWFIASVNLS